MPKKLVPSAWEDDWEAQADKAAAEDKETGGVLINQEPVILSRAERLAKHAEEQRKLWQSADEPEEFHFLAATSTIPSGVTVMKPAMKVLSRKPAPQMIKRRDPVTGLEKLTIHDDAAEAAAEAEAEAARNQLTPEQIRQRQQREREEKQRKYDEARAKIFGEPAPKPAASSGAGAASPGPSSLSSSRQASPSLAGAGSGSPFQQPHHHHHSNSGSSGGGRGRGRGRGHRGDYRGDYRGDRGDRSDYRQTENRRPQSGQSGQSGHSGGAAARELYDPSYSPRPAQHTRRGGGSDSASCSDAARSTASPQMSRSGTLRDDDLVIRTPRGPDGSGRGGFGFSRRGG